MHLRQRLLAWFRRARRNNLPWQHPRTPYRVWLSEVMLQQTQVVTVIPYFDRFVQILPSLDALAAASQDRVLALWSGLGYYSRARNLHRCAQLCVEQHNGDLPHSFEALAALPGIGRSTAGAILAQAFGHSYPILDGNVRRVLARFHGVHGWPGQSIVQAELWRLAGQHTPESRAADYTQAIMDLGALVCTAQQTLLIDVHSARLSSPSRRSTGTACNPARKENPTRKLVHAGLSRRHATCCSNSPTDRSLGAPVELAASENLEQARASAGDAGSLATAQLTELAEFIHTFSHYRLQISPMLLQLNGHESRVSDSPDRGWYAQHELAELGLPAPVRKLLTSIFQENPACEPSTA